MEFLEEIIYLLDADMDTPKLYGWFHILSLAITAVATFLLCFFIKSPTEKTVRRILLIVSLTVIFFEIYKQFNFSFSVVDEKVNFNYQWYAFPFQFCSTPMYVGLLAALIKNKKIHKALCAYLSTFALFAGAAVMLYPNTVYIDTIGINIQTMVCHGTMIMMGVFLLSKEYVETEIKTLFKAIPVFTTALIIACILNEVAYFSGILENHNFDMFFISRHGEPSLPVLSLIQPHLPFVLDVVVYVIGFSIAAYVMLLIAMGVKTLANKIKK